jgi:hypothetical protein
MLELARMFKDRKDVNIRLLFFTLEELNPVYDRVKHETAVKAGIWDNKRNFQSLRFLNDERLIRNAMLKAQKEAQTYSEQFTLAVNEQRNAISSEMRHLYDVLSGICASFDDPMGFGQRALLGSCRWVEKNKPQEQPYIGMIDLDSIGFCNPKPFSHIFPDGIVPTEENSFMVDKDHQSGNFIVAITNKGCETMAKGFTYSARNEQLPYFMMACPMSYAETAVFMPELLLADHGAFWKNDIPCLFLTDTGNTFRYPYEHTPADTIDKLDFDFIAKIVESLHKSILTWFEVTNI